MKNNPIKNHSTVVKIPIFIALSLVVGILLGATFFGGQAPKNNIQNGASKFKEILTLIEGNYVDSVNTDTLVDYAILKMLAKLDPHTTYFPITEAPLVRSQLEASFDGIGIEFAIAHDTVYVMSAIKGGPANIAGIKSGDILLKADNVSLTGAGITQNAIYNRLRGKRGSELVLEVLHENDKTTNNITVVRDRIPSFSVSASYMLDHQTGLIKVERFTESTYNEFKNSLISLKNQGLKRLVLDLRGNPGGYKDRAEKLVDELLGGEHTIVFTRGKSKQYNSVTTTSFEGVFEKGAVIILIDENSASASEIVAGALQDNDRALIVGRRSFGKGLVQMPVSLNDGSELRLTISRYFTPSGRSIQKPYQSVSIDDYDKDYDNRIKSGELFHEDSIKFDKKVTYRTLNGRRVYGGGGIMPDVFIPFDTLYSSNYLRSLMEQNIIRQYAIGYCLRNERTLEKLAFKDFNKFFVVTSTMMDEIVRMASRAKIKMRANEYLRSENYIKTLVKATIARTIWQRQINNGLNNEYYQVMSAEDETLHQALRYFDKAEKMARGEVIETISHAHNKSLK